MFSITSYKGNANQNYNEVSLHTGQNGHYKKKKKLQTINGGGLPWWLSGKDSICHCQRHGSSLWSGKISHVMEQISPCATAPEPVFWRSGVAITEPTCRNYWAHVSQLLTFTHPRACSPQREACAPKLVVPVLCNEKAHTATKTQHSQKQIINIKIFFKESSLRRVRK